MRLAVLGDAGVNKPARRHFPPTYRAAGSYRLHHHDHINTLPPRTPYHPPHRNFPFSSAIISGATIMAEMEGVEAAVEQPQTENPEQKAIAGTSTT